MTDRPMTESEADAVRVLNKDIVSALNAIADALAVIAGRAVRVRSIQEEAARLAAWERVWQRSQFRNHPTREELS